MLPLKRIILEDSGLKYILQSLIEGYTLMNIVKDTVNFSKGCVYTLLPADADMNKVKDYRAGGKLPQPPESEWYHFVDQNGKHRVAKPVPNLDKDLIHIIESALKGTESICIAEDFLAQRRDLGNPAKDNVYFYKEEVYYSITPHHIESTLKDFWSVPHAVCIISMADPAILSHQDLSLEDLYQIASGTTSIFVNAYDGEGFVIWSTI